MNLVSLLKIASCSKSNCVCIFKIFTIDKTIFTRDNFSLSEYRNFVIFHISFNFVKPDVTSVERYICLNRSVVLWTMCVLRQFSLKSTLIRSPRLRGRRERCLRIFRVRDLSRKIRPGREIMLRLCATVDVSTSGQCYKSFRTHKRLTPRLSCAFLSGISGRPRRNISRYENTRAYEGNLKL